MYKHSEFIIRKLTKIRKSEEVDGLDSGKPLKYQKDVETHWVNKEHDSLIVSGQFCRWWERCHNAKKLMLEIHTKSF